MNSRSYVVGAPATFGGGARVQPVPIDAVQMRDTFWAPRIHQNRTVTLRHIYEQLEAAGNFANFRRAAAAPHAGDSFVGFVFNDSDVYKWLEAASWAFASSQEDAPDLPELRTMVDNVINLVEAAQQPDGYLNTAFMFDRAEKRWSNLTDEHEMYCLGHLIQAAVAHHRVTGSDRLLRVAQRATDQVCDLFGDPPAKRDAVDGHPEIEMALVELARLTGNRRYLDQAGYFLNARGRGLVGSREPLQDHVPFRDLQEVTGHAVRMLYLACGATDILMETGDASLRTALEQLWANLTERKMYITGGAGALHKNEAFGPDYFLPNDSAYAETCAGIANVMWNWRMLLLTGDARYADTMELALYNGVLSGIALDGKQFFYVNPLAASPEHRRQSWYKCACCPPNISRLLASLPGYFYGVSDEGVWVHLFASNSASLDLPDGRRVRLTQQTEYPWHGDVTITVEAEGEFTMFLRHPAWAPCQAWVNGELWLDPPDRATYYAIRRHWRPGDTIRWAIGVGDLPVHYVTAHPRVDANAGRAALVRGPLVYCIEGVDYNEAWLENYTLMPHQPITAEFAPNLLGGVVVLRGELWRDIHHHPWEADASTPRQNEPPMHLLYQRKMVPPTGQRVPLVAIPYFAWANREPSFMQVWLRVL